MHCPPYIYSYIYSRFPTPHTPHPTPDSRFPTPDSRLPTPQKIFSPR
ncbi:MAG: hypothetical protein F6K50_17705 [Moorea sp. SIO3I7]|nr:hypothetical protein [Moorena sp. SIO3I8]NEN97295.1 hypothetical protein [Moorena sp. SIO3I7]NEO04420.1 hypothetical protein [Moorena sp. SIO3I8]